MPIFKPGSSEDQIVKTVRQKNKTQQNAIMERHLPKEEILKKQDNELLHQRLKLVHAGSTC